MNRLLVFAAGMAAGICVALFGAPAVLPGAIAAPQIDPEMAQPMAPGAEDAELPPKYLKMRCAPGFKHSPSASGRYTCNHIATVRCPDGATPAAMQIYRSGGAAGDARLIYQCRMSRTVRPHCGPGFRPANLKLYRSGGRAGETRLIYECMKYRKGN